MEFENSLEFARLLDERDELRSFRSKFHFPMKNGKETVYLNGNSLGLQPKTSRDYLFKELEDWKNYGVEGHFKTNTPWLTYHDRLIPSMADIVGADPEEVTIMNTLTVNLHLMMVSFYRPTVEKYKILIDFNAFPSDIYAIKSQIEFHGFDPDEALIELQPDDGEIVSTKQIEDTFRKYGDEISLVLIGGVNYYTGQVYPMKKIVEFGQKYNCTVGFDLAHAVGNVSLSLHNWDVDFAVWCTYKYLNSGPGSIGGCFVHKKHHSKELPRFAGWWGHDKESRFDMKTDFVPIAGAEGWQISNPPIMSLATIKASLDVFSEVEFDKLVEKSRLMVSYCRFLLKPLEDALSIITPSDPSLSGSQLSLVINENGTQVHETLEERGIVCDWREPDVIRIAFAPLYNSFEDVYIFSNILTELIS